MEQRRCGLQRRWVNWVASASQVSKLWKLNSDHFSLGLMILWLGHLDRAQLGMCAPLGFEWGHAVVSRSRCILEGLEGHSQVVPWWMDGGPVQLVMPTREKIPAGPDRCCRVFVVQTWRPWVPSVSQTARWRSLCRLQKLQSHAYEVVLSALSMPSEHAVLLWYLHKPISGQDIYFNLF